MTASGRRAPEGRLLLAFGAASLAAVALGAVTCQASGVPAALWMRNLAAWALGAAAAAALARAPLRPLLAGAPWLALLLLAASFAGPGQLGVHRWVQAGPVSLNAALLALPAAVAALAGAPSARRWAPLMAGLSLLVLQPDASQATALAAVLALVAVAAAPGRAARWGLAALCAGLATLAWLRPDPLPPVPEVEQILALALAVSPGLAAATFVAIALAAAAPAVFAQQAGGGAGLAGAALSLCLGVWALAPFVGAFPVPFAGVGVSPILGAWLGVGVLAAVVRAGARGAVGS